MRSPVAPLATAHQRRKPVFQTMNSLTVTTTTLMRAAGRTVSAIAICALALTAVPSGHAQAQGGGGFGLMQMLGGGGGFGRGGEQAATYTSRDLDKAAEILGWDDAQKAAAKTLLDQYQEQFNTKAGEFRDAMDKARKAFQEDQDPAVWDGVRKKGEELGKARTELDKSFMTDLKSLGTDDQAPKWNKFERTMRREQGADKGWLAGERINLLGIVEKSDLSEPTRASLAPTLDQYEGEIDREYQNRQKVIEEVQAESQKIFGNMRNFRDMQNLDFKQMDTLLNKIREASNRVREVNRKYARQIESQLPEDKRKTFAAEIKKQSYPMIYRPAAASRQMDAALGFGDLTAEQKDQIQQLKVAFERDLVTVNDQLAKAQDDTEMTMKAEDMMNFGRQDGPEADLRKKKRDLGTSTEDKLKKILSPEQVGRLPAGGPDDGGQRPQRRQGGNQPQDNNADRPARRGNAPRGN